MDSTGTTLSLSQPFRFLDLHAELRNKIYEDILFDFPPTIDDIPLGYKAYCTCSRRKYARHCFNKSAKINTNILLTSRQVFFEARHVVLQRAKLVRIKSQGVPLDQILALSHLPMLDLKYKAFCVMTHFMLGPDLDQKSLNQGFIVRGKDVDIFCRGLMGDCNFLLFCRHDGQGTRDWSRTIHHAIVLGNPFNKGPYPIDSEFMKTTEIQRQMLQPYGKILRGFPSTRISAVKVNLDEALARDMEKKIQSEPIPDPLEFSAELERLIKLGNESFRKGKCHSARVIWTKGLQMCGNIIGNLSVWHKLQARAGPGYAESILDAVYRLINNRICSAVRIIRKAILLKDGRAVDRLLLSINESYLSSKQAPQAFQAPGWMPQSAKEAQLAYRVASGTRSTRKERWAPAGYDAICRAFALAPGDSLFKKEKQEYEKWRQEILAQPGGVDINQFPDDFEMTVFGRWGEGVIGNWESAYEFYDYRALYYEDWQAYDMF